MLCIAFERVFIVVPDNCVSRYLLWMIWGNNAFTLNFVYTRESCIWNAGKKKGSVTMSWREQIFECFSWFRRGEAGRSWWRSGRLFADRTDENMEKVKKTANEDRRSTISNITGRLSLFVRNLPVNCTSSVGTTSLRVPYVCVSRWRAEATACTCVPRTVESSQKRSIFTLEGHNRGRNLGFPSRNRKQKTVVLV